MGLHHDLQEAEPPTREWYLPPSPANSILSLSVVVNGNTWSSATGLSGVTSGWGQGSGPSDLGKASLGHGSQLTAFSFITLQRQSSPTG